MKTGKKRLAALLAVLLTLSLLLCAVPAILAAEETASGTCGENLTWTLADGVLTISGTGDMEDHPWGSYSDQITSVVIEDGVTSIVDNAFYGCTSLTSITIPASVTGIGGMYGAGVIFTDCTSLTDITVSPDNTAYASKDGVLYDKEMTDLLCYPAGKAGAVNVPNSVTYIGSYAFYGCAGLTSITIPASVTSIGVYAFSGCSGLTSVTLPEGLTSIGSFAFSCCTSLTSVAIPASVTRMGGKLLYQRVFGGCTNLTDVNVSPDNTVFASMDGVLYNKEMTRMIFCPEGKVSVVIPNGVTGIIYDEFVSCSRLTSVTIPKSVTIIGGYEFEGCSSLTDIYYAGSEEEWAEIEIDKADYGGVASSVLRNATIHYNSTGPEKPSIIIEGTDESYTLGSEDAAVIHCSGALADFVSVSVDGAVVSDVNYDLEEGSTILTFKASYLETLSVGKHTVTLTYTTGSVDTTLTVLEKASTNPETTEPETTEPETTESDGVADETNPKDGDSAILLLPAGLMLACALSLLYLNRKKRVQ